MIVGVFIYFKIQSNLLKFIFLTFFLSNIVLSVASATEGQCDDPRYTSRLSIIKIIPFIIQQHITELDGAGIFFDKVRQPLVAAVAKHASWVGDQKDELINRAFSQIVIPGLSTGGLSHFDDSSGFSAATHVDHVGTFTTDALVCAIAFHVVDEISKLHSIKLAKIAGTTAEHSFLVPSEIHFINVSRIVVGQIGAEKDCGDIEQFGFRRYLRYPKKELTYRPSEFNYGRTFVYPKQIELQQLGIVHPFGLLPDQHRVITDAVSSYAQENYDGENILFVTMFVRADETILHRITCGTFVSGTSQPSSQPIQDIFGGTNSVKLSLIQNNWEAIEPFTSGIMPQKVEDLTKYLKCYDKKPFRHPHGNRRFPPVSGATDKIRPQIKSILGQWPEPPSKDTVSPELSARIEFLYGESPVLSRVDIYGENELKGVLRSGKDGAFGTCFHQSEQHFSTLMDLSASELGQLGDHLHVYRCVNSLPSHAVVDNSDSVANNIVVCFYNRKDMCRYCRATFSHMMGSKLINRKICAFVNKIFDDTDVFANPHDETPVQIYAFAKETTEL